QQGGEGQEDVVGAHDDRVDPHAPRLLREDRRNDADRGADEQGDADGDDADQQGDPCPVHHPCQRVATELVGAQRMGGAGRLEPRDRVDVTGAVGRPEEGDERETDDEDDEAAADGHRRVETQLRAAGTGRRRACWDGRARCLDVCQVAGDVSTGGADSQAALPIRGSPTGTSTPTMRLILSTSTTRTLTMPWTAMSSRLATARM